jgi:hypothetical protein
MDYLNHPDFVRHTSRHLATPEALARDAVARHRAAVFRCSVVLMPPGQRAALAAVQAGETPRYTDAAKLERDGVLRARAGAWVLTPHGETVAELISEDDGNIR